jgi:hypothetical protein
MTGGAATTASRAAVDAQADERSAAQTARGTMQENLRIDRDDSMRYFGRFRLVPPAHAAGSTGSTISDRPPANTGRVTADQLRDC